MLFLYIFTVVDENYAVLANDNYVALANDSYAVTNSHSIGVAHIFLLLLMTIMLLLLMIIMLWLILINILNSKWSYTDILYVIIVFVDNNHVYLVLTMMNCNYVKHNNVRLIYVFTDF